MDEDLSDRVLREETDDEDGTVAPNEEQDTVEESTGFCWFQIWEQILVPAILHTGLCLVKVLALCIHEISRD